MRKKARLTCTPIAVSIFVFTIPFSFQDTEEATMIAVLLSTKTGQTRTTNMTNLAAERRENPALLLELGRLKIAHQRVKSRAKLKRTMKMKMTMKMMTMEISRNMICGVLTQRM